MGWLLAAPDLRTLTSIPLEPQALYRFHLGNPRAKIGPRRCDFIPGAGGGEVKTLLGARYKTRRGHRGGWEATSLA